MSKRSSIGVKNWRRRTKEKIINSMGGSCIICGYNKCFSALELHHINPEEKEITLSKLKSNPKNLLIISYELRKCVLLCANCHREIHAGLICLPDTYPTFNENILFEDHEEIKVRKNTKEQETLLKKAIIQENKIKKSKLYYYTNEELFNKLNNEHRGNKSSLSRELNVSETAIRKRLNNFLKKRC